MKNQIDISKVKQVVRDLIGKLDLTKKEKLAKVTRPMLGTSIMVALKSDALTSEQMNALVNIANNLHDDIESGTYDWLNGRERSGNTATTAESEPPEAAQPEPVRFEQAYDEARQGVPVNRMVEFTDEEKEFDQEEDTPAEPAEVVDLQTYKEQHASPASPSEDDDPMEVLMESILPRVNKHFRNGGFPRDLVEAVVDERVKHHVHKIQVGQAVSIMRSIPTDIFIEACKILKQG